MADNSDSPDPSPLKKVRKARKKQYELVQKTGLSHQINPPRNNERSQLPNQAGSCGHCYMRKFQLTSQECKQDQQDTEIQPTGVYKNFHTTFLFRHIEKFANRS